MKHIKLQTINLKTHQELNEKWLQDVNKGTIQIPKEFFDKYKRRFERLYNKIIEHDTIHFIHCFDFQWLSPYFPTKEEIDTFFKCCKTINPICNVQLYFLIDPKHDTEENQDNFKLYETIENVNLFFLKNKGWQDDWKAGHLNFEDFFNSS